MYSSVSSMTANGHEETGKLINTVAAGGILVFLSILIGKGVNLGIHLALANSLTLEEYGLYSLAYSIFLILGKITLMGVPTGVLRFSSSYNALGSIGEVKGILVSGYIIVLVNGFIFGSVFVLLNEYIVTNIFHKPGMSFILKAFVFLLPVYGIMRLTHFVVRSFRLMGYYAFLKEILVPMVYFGFIVLLYFSDFSLKNVVYAYIITLIVSTIINLGVLKRICKGLKSEGAVIYRFKKLMRYSFPIFLVGFSYLLLNQTSKVIIGVCDSSESVGIYNAAISISVLIIIFLNCVDAVFAPVISELYTRKRMGDLRQLVKTSTRWIFTSCIPVCVATIIFSKDMMSLFGEGYITGYFVLIVLVIGYTVSSITGSVAYILQMAGKQDVEFFNMLAIVALNIFLNFLLVVKYGLLGAGIATSLSIALLNIVRLIEVRYYFNIHPYDVKYVKPILAIFGTVVVYWILSWSTTFRDVFWMIRILVFLIMYGSLLIMLKLEPEDLQVIEDAKKKYSLKYCGQKTA